MKNTRNNQDKYFLSIGFILFSLLMSYASCSKANVVDMIKAEAHRQHFDPRIAVAVAITESSLNQNAIGKAGEIGLYQILPRVYPRANLHDLKTNIRLGIMHLKYWQRVCPTNVGITFVNCYNSGFKHPKYPLLRPYVRKVAYAMRRYND